MVEMVDCFWVMYLRRTIPSQVGYATKATYIYHFSITHTHSSDDVDLKYIALQHLCGWQEAQRRLIRKESMAISCVNSSNFPPLGLLDLPLPNVDLSYLNVAKYSSTCFSC
jgi:hypothetical protein